MADCDFLTGTLFDKRALARACNSHYCDPHVVNADYHKAVSPRLVLNGMPYRSSYSSLAPVLTCRRKAS
jgi:hypothetical protein